MKEAIKWILSAVVGIVVSVIIALISSGVHLLLTCAIAAYSVSAILYYGFLKKSDMKLLISVIAFIIIFISYLLLYYYADAHSNSWGIALLVFCAPYVLCSYVFFKAASIASQDNIDDNNNDHDKV